MVIGMFDTELYALTYYITLALFCKIARADEYTAKLSVTFIGERGKPASLGQPHEGARHFCGILEQWERWKFCSAVCGLKHAALFH